MRVRSIVRLLLTALTLVVLWNGLLELDFARGCCPNEQLCGSIPAELPCEGPIANGPSTRAADRACRSR